MAFDDLIQDLRYTVRTLRRDAGFTTFAVLIAGLGIGASATVFSVVHTLLLRPLPFAEPRQLVWIANRDTSGLSGQTTQVGHMLDLRERTQSLSAVAGYFAFYGVGDNLLSGSGEPERLSGVPVSDNFFDVLGVKPQIGRVFNAEECKWKGPKAVMLGHGLWQRRFNADPAIVGTALILNDEPHTVVGVLPASFDFASVFAPGSHFDLYFPFPLSQETNRWGNTMAMIGRLKPGVTVEQARAEIRTIAGQIVAEHPERNGFQGNVKPLAEQVSGRVRLAVWVLAGAVGMVMLIVCANLSNLLLARTATRQKEVAIRTALGAGRRRLLAQLLTEGIVLSCSGALLGLLLAVAGTRALARLDAVSIPLLHDVQTDLTALTFTLAIAIATGIVFGLAPALQLRGTALTSALNDAARGSTEGRQRAWIRNALVVAEVAFACVLVVGAGLLVRSLIRVLDVEMGFQPSRAMTIRVDPDSRYSTREQRITYFNEVLRQVKEIPGVEAAGITDALPLGRNRTWGAGAKGVTYERGKFPFAFPRIVSDGYSAAMGIPLDRRPRYRRERHGDERARHRRQRDDGAYAVAGTGSDRQVPARWMRQGAACGWRHRRCPSPGARAGLRQRDVHPDAPMRRSAVRGSGRPIQPAAVTDRVVDSREAAAARRQSTGQRFPDAAADRRSLGVAAALPGAAARRLRRLRAGARVARDLRVDLVLGESAHAGNRHPDGARRLCARRAGRHHQADAEARRDRHGARHGRVVDHGAERRRPAVRHHRARPGHFPGDAAGAHARGDRGRLSAGAPGVEDRSDGRAEGGVTRVA